MPILDLQQRMKELGRIRTGQKGAKGAPTKLDRFRLTSPSEQIIRAVADLYGGTPQPWTPADGRQEWEVITDTARIPILVPPQSVSQYYELWSGGGCQRRCDGITELLSDQPCICGPDPEARECKPTTRLNVILRDVPGVGVWRLESHGYWAAVELPQVAEFLASATAASSYLPAFLVLHERVVKRDGQTRRFHVPGIEVEVTPAQLMAGQGGAVAIGGQGPTAVTAGGPLAIETGGERPDYAALAADATTADEVRGIWKLAADAGQLTAELKETLTARGQALAPPAQEPPGVGADVDTLWQQIVAACPEGWTLDDLEQRFADHTNGTMPGAASAGEHAAFLEHLRKAAI